MSVQNEDVVVRAHTIDTRCELAVIGMPNALRDYRLLIVDDDDVDQRFYRKWLLQEAPGVCEIQQVRNGAAGLAALRVSRFDCVLLDFNLPDMSGLEFLTYAAVESELPCAFVLITGQGNEKIAVEAMKRGVQDYLIKDQMDACRLWDAVIRVITQRELRQRLADSQRDLHHREALLRSILDTVPDALVVIDKQGAIQSFSTAAERLFGYSSAEITGQNVSLLMTAPDREHHDGYLARYLSTGARNIIGVGSVVVGQRKDGSTFPMDIAVGEVNMPGAELYTSFVRDLTERRDQEHRVSELQAQLVHISRVTDLGQMVSALAHEVTQPLTAMASYLSVVRRLIAAGNEERIQQVIEQTATQCDRASQIVRRLRDHVKKRPAEKRREDLQATIEELGDLTRVGVARNLKLDIRVDCDAAEALIDKVEIQQVLLNLIRNAAEAMVGSAQHELSIATSSKGDMVEISVADSGPGLSESVRTQLFRPFVTTKPSGMGVGLSVCRTIVEAHGGEIRAENRAGGGTVFRFTVPRQ